ncbi:hypothetical protein H0H81_002469 [Sphagnurus paluster]|uniref:Uncharacterized protein n=1 Tax=Sphagnurus paluster TaxID=117069 RepID=A0A9P7KHF7_9AGAR|nr:hypothetical protein H0H81_002469 [Sphagnurus paluster]
MQARRLPTDLHRNAPNNRIPRRRPLFASPAALAAGNHMLKVEVLSLAKQMSLMLDYIVYTPSADALAALPTTTEETSTAPTDMSTLVPMPVPTVDKGAGRKLGGVVLISSCTYTPN